MPITIALVDNYDSFTYNLAYALRHLGAQVDVFLNDAVALEALASYDKILLSPGPGLPADAGIMPAVIRTFASSKPILGICLGHQAIAEAFGGQLYNLSHVLHGVATPAHRTTDDSLFQDLPVEFAVGRYHSWAVVRESLPASLRITATDAQGCILALRHAEYDVVGLQFHPESVLTPHGTQMLQNWLAS
jgi:anthranilate synthase component 2